LARVGLTTFPALLRFVAQFGVQVASIGCSATEIDELTLFAQIFFIRSLISAWVTTDAGPLLLLL
jgi:hypothetical protein